MKTINLNFLITLVFFTVILHSAQRSSAQVAAIEKEEVYEFADKQATFKGNYLDYLVQNINYPQAAVDSNIQGTVYLDVFIGKAGEIKDVVIRKNPGGGLGEEAARVVKSMPAWNPAYQNGKPVNFKMTLPVKFVLAPDDSDTLTEVPDVMPVFKGGNMNEYIKENTIYPESATERNIQGTVFLDVIIGRKGEIKRVKIIKNPGGGLGEEAARVVKNMPAWEPGTLNGKAVNVRLVLPVKFVLAGRATKKNKTSNKF